MLLLGPGMKVFYLIVFFSVALLSWTLFDWQPYLQNPALIRDAVQDFPLWAPLVFFLISIITEVLLIPGSPFTIAGGLLFGVIWGSAISLIASVISAVIIFAILRHAGQGFFVRYFHERFPLVERYNNHLVQNGFWHVLFVRLLPVTPGNLINVAYGMSKVDFWDYTWATLLGNLPSTIILTWLGARIFVWTPRTLIIVFLALFVLGTVASYLYERYWRKSKQAV